MEDVVGGMTSENKNGLLCSCIGLHTKAKANFSWPVVRYCASQLPLFWQTCQRKRQNFATRAWTVFKATAVACWSDIFALSDLLLIARPVPLGQLWGKCLANSTGRNQLELNPWPFWITAKFSSFLSLNAASAKITWRDRRENFYNFPPVH